MLEIIVLTGTEEIRKMFAILTVPSIGCGICYFSTKPNCPNYYFERTASHGTRLEPEAAVDMECVVTKKRVKDAAVQLAFFFHLSRIQSQGQLANPSQLNQPSQGNPSQNVQSPS